MRLVENERVRAGQDLAEALLLDRQVGEQQVVVDHHQIGLLRRAPRLDDEAFAERGAVGAEAVLGGRGHARPQRRILRHLGQFGAIAGRRARRPDVDRLQLGDLFAAGETPFLPRLLEPVQAQVVRAALQQRRADARAEDAAHLRQVAMEQLVLQRLGAGRDDHAPARRQRGHEIGEGLPGAGAGLGDEHLAVGDRLLDRHRHRLLRGARREAGHFPRERPLGAEQIGGGGHGLRAED